MFCLKWFKPLSNVDDKLPMKEGPIMNMPDLVMRKILKDIDLLSTLTLRRVCHAFRNFIDDMKLDYGITRIGVEISPGVISVELRTESRNYLVFHYIRLGRSCLQIIASSRINANEFLVNESFVDAFSNDIGAILRNQKTPIDYWGIAEEKRDTCLSLIKFDKAVVKTCLYKTSSLLFKFCSCRQLFETDDDIVQYLRRMHMFRRLKPTANDVYDCLENILKSRDYPIHIRDMSATVNTPQSHFLSIARCIDMKQLRNFKATNYNKKNKQLTLNEIVELNNWECIRELRIIDFNITLPLEIFLHKSKLTITIPKITKEEVLLIKNNFLTSPLRFHEYIIYYNHLTDEDELYLALGAFSEETIGAREWSFEIPETNGLLKVWHYTHFRNFTFYW